MGNAYLRIAALRDLDAAEYWYRQCLELHAPGDAVARGSCLGQLGGVALVRFEEAQKADRPEAELLAYLNVAAVNYHRALDLIPEEALGELGAAHNQLGLIFSYAANVDRALLHYQQSIRYSEESNDLYCAGRTRCSVATMLLGAGRLLEASDYAEAALANFREFGGQAGDMLGKAKALLTEIDANIAKGSRP